MKNRLARVRTPVRRAGAEKYLLLTLLSFAGSVSLTRLFLFLTGYPQVGNGELHIAHVLWGGLLLYIAVLVPLLFANRWAFTISGIMSGIGIGLFIDEVGKFITQTNDYFYPPAAPIVYAFFLLSVLLYQRIRTGDPRDTRSQLYTIMDGMEEVLDHDLSDQERADMIERLDEISEQTPAQDLSDLAQALKGFITSEKRSVVPHTPGLLERAQLRYKTWENRRLTRRSFQAAITGGSLALAIWMLSNPLITLFQLTSADSLRPRLSGLIERGMLRGSMTLNWFEARIALEMAVGLILVIGCVILFRGKDRLGTNLIYLGLLLSLTTVDLFVFYFNQFSTILNALVQLILLMVVLYYRKNYIYRPGKSPAQD